FNTNYLQLIIYAIMIGIAYPIVNVPYVSLTYDVIGKARQAKEWRVEYIVVRELFVNIGRVIAILVFLIAVSIFSAEQSIPVLLALFGMGHLIIYFFVKNIYLANPSEKDILVKDRLVDEKNRSLTKISFSDG